MMYYFIKNGILIYVMLFMSQIIQGDKTMEYRPNVEIPVDKFIIGTVIQDKELRKVVNSPSIKRQDRLIEIRTTLNEQQNKLEISYDSQSYVFFEINKTYLFAVSGDECVGFLEMKGETQVLLNDSTSYELQDFIKSNLHKPFPDLLGVKSKIIKGEDKENSNPK